MFQGLMSLPHSKVTALAVFNISTNVPAHSYQSLSSRLFWGLWNNSLLDNLMTFSGSCCDLQTAQHCMFIIETNWWLLWSMHANTTVPIAETVLSNTSVAANIHQYILCVSAGTICYLSSVDIHHFICFGDCWNWCSFIRRLPRYMWAHLHYMIDLWEVQD